MCLRRESRLIVIRYVASLWDLCLTEIKNDRASESEMGKEIKGSPLCKSWQDANHVE
jgi:hypothetical protein